MTRKLKTANIRPVTNININIAVGTVVPATVALYPVPEEIVEIVPAWRRYRVIIIKKTVLIVEPSTREIVEIIRLA